MPQQFDVNAARKSGASDDQILSYLAARSPQFDTSGALKVSPKADVISYLSTHATAPQSNLPTMDDVRALGDRAVAAQTRDRSASQIAQAEDSTLGGLSRIPGNIFGGLKALVTSPFTDPTTGAITGPSAENMVGNLWVKPALQSAQHVSDVAAAHGQTGTAREAIGRGIAAVPMVGPWVMGSEGQPGLAERKSAGGILAEALGTQIAGAGIGAGISKVARALPESIPAGIDNVTTRSVQAAYPEAAALPAKALSGAEDVFRAAAPVGSDPQFRGNLYAAAGDLAEIGRNLDLKEARGGVIQPDMRVRASVDAINEHLQQMYDIERKAQIERNADAPVVPNLSTDASAGLEYLSRNAGTHAERGLAVKAMSNGSISLAESDKLAMAVNRELAPLRGMTPQELAVSEGNSKRFASLQALDRDLSQSIGNELSNRGEGGIGAYERRYAGLSQVRDQLQSRMNMAELQRTNNLRSAFGLLTKPSIAGASQAATANVNLGRMLQNGFRKLADSGIAPNRPAGTGPRNIRGLIGPGATQLPSNMEPIGQPSGSPPILDYRPSLQSPSQFVSPAAIRPAGPEPTLLPEGDLFRMLIQRGRK
jgi:hypothetical protein